MGGVIDLNINLKSSVLSFLQEVREMWAGLGYYSRGQRLWEGAKKVCGIHQRALISKSYHRTHKHLGVYLLS